MGTAAHLILVGIPGAGKSTVGVELARALKRPFVDLDEDIVARAGTSVREIFSAHGEAHFRALEREATQRIADAASPMVIAPGGGWITVPGLVDMLRPPATLIWLRISPVCALERLGEGVATRPLLAGADPLGALSRLAEAREAFYLQADHTLSVDSMTPSEVVAAILPLARR